MRPARFERAASASAGSMPREHEQTFTPIGGGHVPRAGRVSVVPMTLVHAAVAATPSLGRLPYW